MPFGGKTATLLQSPAQLGIPATLAFDALAAVVFAITISRQVVDTQSNPKATPRGYPASAPKGKHL
jgi:hypothetical protein